MNRSPRKILLIFVRNPELGKVKTRLAQGVGEEQALRIYLALLARTREVALAVDVHRRVCYSHFIDREDEWAGPGFEKYLQQGKDLGERMDQAFTQALQDHDRSVIIGSDCPLITPALLRTAFRKLEEHPFVMGPATDGGYYLLGMRTPSPTLFRDIEWSTGHVAADTLQRIRALGQTCALLPELPDIDYAEDWEKYGWPLAPDRPLEE